VTGHKGAYEGLDYRGVPVLSVLNEVLGTPWFMVIKVDQDEIYSPLRERVWISAAVIIFLILAAGLGVGLFWRQRDNQWLKEKNRFYAPADRILHLNQHASDIIMLFDQDWRILEANERAVEVYGYSPRRS